MHFFFYKIENGRRSKNQSLNSAKCCKTLSTYLLYEIFYGTCTAICEFFTVDFGLSYVLAPNLKLFLDQN